jgi:glycine cleavage system aminomethyltransferase T
LTIEGGVVPEAGVAVTRDGENVGALTSPVASPRFGTIGLAVLSSGAAADGTQVRVGDASATVAPLSVYDPGKQRPRS